MIDVIYKTKSIQNQRIIYQ